LASQGQVFGFHQATSWSWWPKAVSQREPGKGSGH
jgi:hypothetical protein